MTKDEITDLVKQAVKTLAVPIHPEGWKFVGIFAIASLLLGLLWGPLGMIGLVLTLWCLYFFRDPVRVTPTREDLIISPADGMVQMITKAPLPPELEPPAGEEDDPLYTAKSLTRVSIFLNVFDVHVNRVPIAGTIQDVIYHPGKFFNASLDKASLDNERSVVSMKMANGKSSIVFVQIAGFVARRILCDAKPGQKVETGERYGLIRFGSRVDIYMPPRVNPMVIEGQRVIGGETVIADIKSREKTREGEVR